VFKMHFQFKQEVWDKKDVVSNAFTIILGCIVMGLIAITLLKWVIVGVIMQVFGLGILFVIKLSWVAKKANNEV
jgi:hypothetical protein